MIKQIPPYLPVLFFIALFNSSHAHAAQLGGCFVIPASVKTAFSEAKNFSQGCEAAKLAPDKMIAVNDYSGDGTPMMYIFDQNGNCQDSMEITWGSGAGGKMEACSTESSKQTPPGFHITAKHEGGERYDDSNSIGLAGLSGQNSLGERGILIHCAESPGTASSWGCTGVPKDKFSEVKAKLGIGSLVYNYFGTDPKRNCSDNAGFAPPQCKPEALAVQASRQANGTRAVFSSSGASGGGGKKLGNQ